MYDRVVNGKELVFGIRGSLAERGDWRGVDRMGAMIVFYDTATKSCWWEGNGSCMSGIHDGHRLKEIPAEKNVTWQEWVSKHPDTLVFSYNGQEE